MASSCLRLPSTGTTPPPSPSSSTRTHWIDCRSSFLGCRPSGLYRSRSLEIGIEERKGNNKQTLRRAASADLQVFDEDDEFMKRLQELALGGNPRIPERKDYSIEAMTESVLVPSTSSSHSGLTSPATTNRQPWQVSGFGPSISIPQGGIHNSCDMPASLRLIKQKKKRRKQAAAGGWEDGFLMEVGESARSSVNNAFSSMVFMIRELQSFTLHMRQGLFYEDLQDILGRVQQDMHASFVWLFQQIFSGTPALMVSIMLLLANFTVYSMTDSVAMAAPLLSQPQISVVAVVESSTSEQKSNQMQFDHAPAVKNFSSGRMASVGGSGSGGGKVRPVAGSTDDGQSEGPSSSLRIARGAVEVVREEEEAAWSRMVEEAKQMQVGFMDPAVLKWMANPVTVTVENDGYTDYKRTELDYQLAVQDDPQNSLLLTNFALFLQLVLHDSERAEYYFKKAVAVEPADGDAFSKYANFLWVVKNDTEAAEEKYLEALMADPGNSFHAASYAHFLWNTGGEDTCFPDYA